MFYVGLISLLFGLHVPAFYWILYLFNLVIIELYNGVVVNYNRKYEFFKSSLGIINLISSGNMKDFQKHIVAPKHFMDMKNGFCMVLLFILINANKVIFSKIGYHSIPFVEYGVVFVYCVSILLTLYFIISVLVKEPEDMRPKKDTKK
jgi:hypothetical protein